MDEQVRSDRFLLGDKLGVLDLYVATLSLVPTPAAFLS
jgi:hypothetical protein